MDGFSGNAAADMSHRRQRVQYAATTIHNMAGLNEPPVVAVVENAPGIVGPEVHEHLMHYPWVKTMQEWTASSDIYGVPPHPDIRNRQTGRMEARLAQGLLAFADNCSTYPLSLGGQDLEKQKTKLALQLMGWQRIVEYNRNKPLMKPRVGWSAKQTAGNDDYAVAALMMDWAEVFFSAERSWRYGDWIQEWVTPRCMGARQAAPTNSTAIHEVPELGAKVSTRKRPNESSAIGNGEASKHRVVSLAKETERHAARNQPVYDGRYKPPATHNLGV